MHQADLAQLVERFTCNEDAAGSTPAIGTKFEGKLAYTLVESSDRREWFVHCR
ncbi:hypothetical protein KNU12_gp106 [Klebsiella phage KP179]|uniref:Uncharacterized protein n=1 Tax=Klebsiella phage KP179 TaxID=2315700 RepID=A0A386K6H0_9CAUD|nr:hypothetical protein KNU12_gp106 [Klebsiella phage KP179]AYD80748.1 hypothetical protein [Klebsiella phage KP179]